MEDSVHTHRYTSYLAYLKTHWAYQNTGKEPIGKYPQVVKAKVEKKS